MFNTNGLVEQPMDNDSATINEISHMTDTSIPQKLTGLGNRLKSARESMNLTEKEVAARLYLNTRIIAFIENENFADGPPMTFMRGYLRSYAKLLNVPDQEIKAAFDEIEHTLPPIPTPTPILSATPRHHQDRYFRWMTYLIILTLGVLVSIWWTSHSGYQIADVPSKTPFQPAIVTAPKVVSVENLPQPVPNIQATATPTPPMPAYGIVLPAPQKILTPPIVAKPENPPLNDATTHLTTPPATQNNTLPPATDVKVSTPGPGNTAPG